MSTLYNLYISGLQSERIHEAETIIEAFSGQFSNRTEKLIKLLKDPYESCFFVNITNQQAQDLQHTLSIMGLICKYRPSATEDDHELKLMPLEKEFLLCPFCNKKQKRNDSKTHYQCLSCGKHWKFIERRKNIKGQRQFSHNNLNRAPKKLNPTFNQEIEQQSVVIKAEIATREHRRTRLVYQNILIFTVLSIITIGIFAIWQTNHKPFNDSETLLADSSSQVTFKNVQTKPIVLNQNNNKSSLLVNKPLIDTITNSHPNSDNKIKSNHHLLPVFQLQKDLQLEQNKLIQPIQSLIIESLIKENEIKNSLQMDTLLNSTKNIASVYANTLTITFTHQTPNRDISHIYQNAFNTDEITRLFTRTPQLHALLPKNLHINSSTLLTLQMHDIQSISNQIAITPNKFIAVTRPHQIDLFNVLYEMEKNYLAQQNKPTEKNPHLFASSSIYNNRNLYPTPPIQNLSRLAVYHSNPDNSPVQQKHKIKWPTIMNLNLQAKIGQELIPSAFYQGMQRLQCLPLEKFWDSMSSHSFSSVEMNQQNRII